MLLLKSHIESTLKVGKTNDGETIDPNICCMCFESWDDDVFDGDGADRISCKCGRWPHEGCAQDVVEDKDGFQRFCSFCVDRYTV